MNKKTHWVHSLVICLSKVNFYLFVLRSDPECSTDLGAAQSSRALSSFFVFRPISAQTRVSGCWLDAEEEDATSRQNRQKTELIRFFYFHPQFDGLTRFCVFVCGPLSSAARRDFVLFLCFMFYALFALVASFVGPMALLCSHSRERLASDGGLWNLWLKVRRKITL